MFYIRYGTVYCVSTYWSICSWKIIVVVVVVVVLLVLALPLPYPYPYVRFRITKTLDALGTNDRIWQ